MADLKPVYLIAGTDRPKIDTALERLRARFAPETVESASAIDTSGEAAAALCNAGSLFGDARLVLVTEAERWKAADVKSLQAYLAAPAPGDDDGAGRRRDQEGRSARQGLCEGG